MAGAKTAGGRAAQRHQGATEARIDAERGVFMISVAAELAEMHPQTLRMYEARGLIAPKRSPKNTRLYSQADVERLRRIQQMTSDEGLNLAGVETVLEMEATVERMRAEMARMRKRAAEMEKRMSEELERLRSSRGRRARPLRRLRAPSTPGARQTGNATSARPGQRKQQLTRSERAAQCAGQRGCRGRLGEQAPRDPLERP